MIKIILILLLCLIFSPISFAQEMTSPSYKLQLEQIETTTNSKLSSLSDKQMKEFIEEGYIITTPKKDTIQFSISDTVLNYNTSQEHDENTILLSAKQLHTSTDSASNFGYRIISQVVKPFQRTNGDTIPLEYNIAGPDSIIEFKNKSYYRSLEKKALSVVAANDWTFPERSSKMNIRLKTATQSNGDYHSVIKLILLPSL